MSRREFAPGTKALKIQDVMNIYSSQSHSHKKFWVSLTHTQTHRLHLITHNDCVHVRIIAMLSILQSQFTEKGFKKTEHFEQNVVLL